MEQKEFNKMLKEAFKEHLEVEITTNMYDSVIRVKFDDEVVSEHRIYESDLPTK